MTESKGRPNILLIMTDQMRGDCLGIAGHPDVKTPYLDQLASQGAWFPNAYTAVPSCIAARCGLLTGLSPEHHGRVGYRDRVDWNYPATMPGELAKVGYYTKCVGKMHVHPLRNLMGFHHIELHDGYLGSYRRADIPFYEHQANADDYFHWLKCQLGSDRDVMDTGIDVNSWLARPWPYEEKYHPTNWVTDRAIDFLRSRDRSRPFFLKASYVRPHPPFDAPQCFFDLYKDKDLTPPPVGDWADKERLARYGRIVDSDTGPIDPELLRQAQVGYYACISHVDNQIGRILNALAEEGVLQDTVILFCSDHGELLGDHHTYRKIRPYQGSVHVPMILYNGGLSGKQENLVELRDIMPTFLELAGATAPETLDGISMLRPNGREYLHGEHSGGDIGNHYIVTKTDKYCWFTQSGREQYFDLKKDPQELCDLSGDPACKERVEYLRNLLVKELAGREEGYSDGVRLIPGRPERSVLSFLEQA